MLVVFDKSAHEELHADRILSGHDDFGVTDIDINEVFGDGAKPCNPLAGFNVVLPVVDQFIFREILNTELDHLFTNPFIETFAASCISGTTNGPEQAEEVDMLELLL